MSNDKPFKGPSTPDKPVTTTTEPTKTISQPLPKTPVSTRTITETLTTSQTVTNIVSQTTRVSPKTPNVSVRPTSVPLAPGFKEDSLTISDRVHHAIGSQLQLHTPQRGVQQPQQPTPSTTTQFTRPEPVVKDPIKIDSPSLEDVEMDKDDQAAPASPPAAPVIDLPVIPPELPALNQLIHMVLNFQRKRLILCLND